MAKIKSLELSDDARTALERTWRHGKSHTLRQRCRMILLKADRRTSKDVAQQVGCCEMVVNTWLKRYQAEGMDGLMTRNGQGRRSILNDETDADPSSTTRPIWPPCAAPPNRIASVSALPAPNWSRSWARASPT